ncbi:MAG TPA: PKD domain-containing protein, partial [Flavobacteriales bacterium]|nr:PKD domain-containing protein [Flavobacteriales bacterium]
GGSVNFTDLSVYSPTSWTWSFPGGTPSSYSGANPPPIVYNTPGTYNVQLSATNANGTDVELKTSYITVNADGGCGQLNYPIPAGWNLVNYYTGATFASDGWINGVNIYADRQKAAYFDASSTPYTTLNNVWIAFGLAWCNNPADIVPIKIYDGTSGSPGSLLGTTNLTMGQIMSDVSGGYYTEANFITNPVTLPASKRFFVAVDLTNLSWTGVKDTLSIVSNTNGETVPSAIWEQQSDLLWYQYNTAGSWSLNASLVIHPWLTSTPTNATFTNSTLTICEDNSVSFDAAGSTYEDTLLWYFPGGSPDLSNNLTETVMYNTPGTYLATLYIVGGGCSLLDSMYVTVTVNAKPAVSVSASAGEICPSGSSTLTASGATSYTWSPTTGLSSGTGTPVTATPASTTTYTVTGTNAAGCQNSAVIEIEVLDPPTASATVGSTLCSGAPVTFDGSLSADATSFAWTLTGGSPSSSTATGGTVTYATAGTYNVELQVTNICGTDTDIVPITVNASPTASFNFSVDTVCTTNGLVSMSGTPSGGVFSGSAVTGSDFDPAAAGAGNFTITYTYTDANSCVDSTSDNIVVEICSGIAEALNSGGVAVFPNPASTVLNILGKTNFDRIQMSDATGRIVARTQFAPTNTQTIDLNNLPNGVYNLQLMSETNVVYSNRIVVSK